MMVRIGYSTSQFHVAKGEGRFLHIPSTTTLEEPLLQHHLGRHPERVLTRP